MYSSPNTVDQYIANLLAPRYDLALFESLLVAAREGGLPGISISASQGQLMHVLVKATGARRILEIGTLGGYSGSWMATALPADGTLTTLELSEKHAAVARKSFELAGVAEKATVIVGDATATLARLVDEPAEPFDIAFIDADKPGYTAYLAACLKLVRKGGLILADNTLSHGVLDGDATSPMTVFNNALAAEPRLSTAIIPVMKDDLDGLSISVVE